MIYNTIERAKGLISEFQHSALMGIDWESATWESATPLELIFPRQEIKGLSHEKVAI